MMTVNTKTQEVKALQWTGTNKAAVLDFTREGYFSCSDYFFMFLNNQPFPTKLLPGTWIVKDAHGDIVEVLSDEEFKARYDQEPSEQLTGSECDVTVEALGFYIRAHMEAGITPDARYYELYNKLAAEGEEFS